MIKKEEYKTREDGVILFRTYSDTDHYIHKVGTDEIYEEAIDVESAPYVYEETEDIIERHPEDEKASFEEEHAGTEDDPIPYSVPMEILEGKYYVEEGVNYLCTRSSGTALSHNLRDLVGIYVGVVEQINE